ncbi:trans-sulfuration enzyme family protein [Lentzea cavernae]|uniref:Cystathionine gamma-synthase n=1 Tax=Lentzea cavernae TaxID=2020703 RepID=A0ABQ3MLG3_9PSEU|nr:aminotransferase class I/II-fold pyridoxal phosphate-dependent enzyme [Lentzea cavernae]GHH48065.1 cystathionine gamma-synthase [Lentzea cavernae]
MNDRSHLTTRAARAGAHGTSGRGGPLVPALHQSTVHSYPDLASLHRVLDGEERGHAYYRFGHYNGRLLEEAVADLEGARDAVATASGMAAISATVLALAEAGDHVVADRNAYGGTRDLLEADLPRLGAETALVDASDLAEVERVLTPRTRLLLVEALTNPTVRVPDLPALVALAGRTGTTVVVDATFATPALFRPLEHGADLVWHSVPKYLGGHSAAMGGIVAGGSDLVGRIRRSVVHLGGTLGPFDAWMALLGLKTLPLRMRAHTRAATTVAEFLAAHPAVARVHHPSRPDHPHASTASRLFPLGTGGMLSFELRGGRPAVDELIRRLAPSIPLSPSLADVASTLVHPATTTHRSLPADQLELLGITDGLIRLSAGIEEPADLVAELGTALAPPEPT